ncbi:sigma-54-dependent transcriptional regulator [Desulfohalovibrio reitneri]|uniref:sigma-54-dependent transcriptional regulator n=1 Tax=Desulfohalovibrio reitneri TaxID=1307759 RepID=UPI0004A7067A|nr:sigma-54 dependent transcriptional regulator [Desulfohalovibrio reitneri]
MQGRILIYDDDPVCLERLIEVLTSLGHQVDMELELNRTLSRLERDEFDLVLINTRDPATDEVEAMTRVKAIRPDVEVIIVTGDPSVSEAVTAIKHGAFHYLSKPFKAEEMAALAQKAMEKRMLTIEVNELREMLGSRTGPKLIGRSPAIQRLKKSMRRVAPLDCTVLITGETGAGKELVARMIHQMSPRADRKFLAVNCGALSEELLSNELFGHEREAFTGASHTRKGLFEAAEGGTLMLDEIGDTSPSMQVQLLRVLQERAFIRVGGTEEIPMDVRVLAATNRDLAADAESGSFREDLYYRLNVFTLRIPPLRERRDDIPLFVRYFLDKYGAEFGKNVERVSDEVMGALLSHPFPGNVRELENLLERAIILCDGPTITLDHLPRSLRDQPSCLEVPDSPEAMPSLAEMERRYIQRVLGAVDGKKTEAAKILGINRASLWRKLKRQENGQGE